MNIYVLTEKLFKALSLRCKPLTCYYCGKPLKVNDLVISFNGQNGSKRYHLECYEKTLH